MACEYCEESTDAFIISEYNVRVRVNRWNRKLEVAHYDKLWDIAGEEINYCPMCGKRLGDKDE